MLRMGHEEVHEEGFPTAGRPQHQRVRHVFVVPDGALQSLPIGVLVSAPPDDKIDYRKVAWLARQFAAPRRHNAAVIATKLTA